MSIVLDLLVGIDWAFIFGLDLLSLSPLPVVIATASSNSDYR